MPIYEYRCENGHHFDVMQKMTDGPVTECEVCGAPVQRVFHPVAVHFKGSGFYNTDYGTAQAQARDRRVRRVRRRQARRQAGREEVRLGFELVLEPSSDSAPSKATPKSD